jgi:dUTP pyrophosphatase
LNRVTVQVTRVRGDADSDLDFPRYMTDHASGLDLMAAVNEPLTIEPGRIVLVPTGLAVAIPPGYEAQIRPRSGLALKHGLTLINTPGTIDADYRGEIGLAVVNLGPEPVTIQRGDRVAQMVVNRVWRAELEIVDQLDETERGGGGFGHTGA